MENYRMDGRSKEQFIQDIKKGNDRERLAIKLFTGFLRRDFGSTIIVEENGVDMSGDFIEDDNKVTAEADYKVNGELMEVKTSSGHSKDIYLKVRQIDSYIKQGASLLYVNGINREVPAFTFWTVEELKEMRQTLKAVTPPGKVNGGKLSYKINASDYDWLTFDGMERRYE